ncbi:MAG TPA: lycopene cyclase domain-containing protein [Anaerolineae bacterium]|nr:lycopene cyclase domain-containing protein [Anaerolineae bacterium]
MTYFGFLLRFLVVPIFALGAVMLNERRRPGSRRLPARDGRSWLVVLIHVVIAVLYTTPWDNYLVATRVWWYDPSLVTGITLGWVPLEEYTFFVLQTLLAGMWVLFLAGHLAPAQASRSQAARSTRIVATSVTMLVWVGAVVLLFAGWAPGTYLALELAWALPPIALQLAFGADILWRYRRLAGLAIVPLTLYLSLGDALAIGSGTWTINPEQSLELLLGGILPLEELLFFLLTTTLVTFGVTLMLAPETLARFSGMRERWRGTFTPTLRA